MPPKVPRLWLAILRRAQATALMVAGFSLAQGARLLVPAAQFVLSLELASLAAASPFYQGWA
jgi:hypothetical protein